LNHRGALVVAVMLAGCGAKHQYPDGRGLQGQLEREVIACQTMMKELQVQTKSCQEGGAADPMYGELKQILVDKALVIEAHGPTTTVTYPDSLVFGTDGWSVRDEARASLDLLSASLKEHFAYTVVIEGHTADVAGSAVLARQFASLLDLSYARARAVRDVLVVDYGVPEDRITIVAKGPYSPVASNDTSAGQEQNRRVVVRIFPPGVNP
jgi:outer membrane protein OmpA-like peptidoglycan-associated protein